MGTLITELTNIVTTHHHSKDMPDHIRAHGTLCPCDAACQTTPSMHADLAEISVHPRQRALGCDSYCVLVSTLAPVLVQRPR